MWQALRAELHSKGFELVTVALDVDPEAARPWMERANQEHPSVIDSGHVVDELLGIVNVPNGIWMDEDGIIVRPAEPAAPERPTTPSGARTRDLPADTPAYALEVMAEARNIRMDRTKYAAALRDWVEKGSSSRYVLTPDEVIARSAARGAGEATGAAQFELGQHLWESGRPDLAPLHWREAHRLQPNNWTYRRQAWILANPLQGPTELYDSDWVTDTRKIGAENYYPPLDM